MIDSDGSGAISADEWETAIDAGFSTIDANGDGLVNFCEVRDAFKQYREDQDAN